MMKMSMIAKVSLINLLAYPVISKTVIVDARLDSLTIMAASLL